MKTLRFFLAILIITPCVTFAQQNNQGTSGIDPEALIERIVAVEKQQRERIDDLTLDAEYVEMEDKGKEGKKEKVRILKKVYLKQSGDSLLIFEDYLQYFKKGELQSDKDLIKETKDRKEKKRKRKARDISYSMLNPFMPDNRGLYKIEYIGVPTERVEGFVCHCFKVTALAKDELLLNGDYYFEAETFHLVKVNFSPAKLVKKMMFKLNELNMTILFGTTPEGYWYPRQFDVQGKGKAAFFIGVRFSGTEYYSNPVINSGVKQSLFVENSDGE